MADMEYTVDLNGAIEAFNNLNAAISQVNASGRSSKKKLQPIIDEIEGLKNVLSGAPAEIDALVASLKKIAINPTTMKGSLRELSAALEAAAKNMKRGTAAVVAVKNQETFSLKRELDRQVELQVKATAKIEAALNKEDRLRSLKGLKPLNPQLKYSTEEERSAALEGIRRKEDEAAETHHTKQRAREAKTTAEFEKQAIEREAIQRRLIEQGTREAQTFDSFSSVGGDAKAKFNKYVADARAQGAELEKLNLRTFKQGLADATKAYNDEADLKAAAINERIKQTQEGEKRTQDILDDSAEINAARIQAGIDLDRKFQALAAKERAKKAQKIASEAEASEKKATKDFQDEVNKRIKAARDFEDAKRSGFTKGQFDSLKGGKLDDLETGARVSSGSPRDQFEAAAVKQMAENFKAAKASQDEVIAGAKRLGIPLRENVERAKEFTLSWQSIGRILVARAVSESFFLIQNSLRQSVQEAVELHNLIAEIQTITDRASQGAVAYETALKRVVDLSSEINFTPDDTADAVYEALSNQIGETTNELTNYIKVAGNLGKVTRASIGDASDAISSVINAYNLSASDALSISAKLFTLVDQGRVKLEEVANHLGNVAVPASQLGISFDHVVAGLSAISIAGVPARESMTLYRNIMFKLIDPTDKMVSLFQQWGVASGQAAIATFGFEGVLSRLNKEAEKGNAEIADLFGTIRAVRGILGLTDENFQRYTDSLEASRKAQEEYNDIVNEYLKNSGERFNKLVQQTSNEVLKLGLRFVDLVAITADFFGKDSEKGVYNLASLVGVLAKMGIVVGAVGGSFLLALTSIEAVIGVLGVFTLATGGATIATGALSTALAALNIHPVIAALSAIAALSVGAVGAFVALRKSGTETFADIATSSQEAYKDLGTEYYKELSEAFDSISYVYQQKTKEALEGAAARVRQLNDEITDLKKTADLDKAIDQFKKIGEALDGDVNKQKLSFYFGDAAESAILFSNGLQMTTKEIEKNKTALEGQASKIQTVIDKLKNQRDSIIDVLNANRDSTRQSIIERNLSRFQGPELSRRQLGVAQDFAGQASNTADLKEANKLFDIAKKFLRDSESSAFQSGALGNLNNHIEFFNRQEAALNAAQERRNAQELQGVQIQGSTLEKEQERLKVVYDRLDAESKDRNQKKEDYGLALSFLEEYKRKSDSINRDLAKGDITPDQASQQLNALNNQLGNALYSEANPVIDKLQGLYSSIIQIQQNALDVAKIELDAASAAKSSSDIQQASLERQKIQDQVQNDLAKTAGEFRTLVESAIADAAPTLGERLKSALTLGQAPGATDSSNNYILIQRTLNPLLDQIENIKKQGEIDPSSVAGAIESLLPEVERILSENTNSDVIQELLKTIKKDLLDLQIRRDSLNTANKSYSDAIVAKEKELETLREQQNKILPELNDETIKKNDEQIKAIKDLPSRIVTEQEQAEAAKKIAQDQNSYNTNRQLLLGNIAGGEGEGDKGIGDGELLKDELLNAWDRFLQDAKNPFHSDDLAQFEKIVAPFKAAAEAMVSVFIDAFSDAQFETKPKDQVSDPGILARPADQTGEQQAIDLAKAQAEAGAMTFIEFIDSAVAAANAEADSRLSGAKINGIPVEMYGNIGDGSNTINGKQFEKKIYPDNYINGVPYINDGQSASPSASFAATQQGVEAGAQAIPQAMQQGSSAISQAVVDGMAEAFRREQMNKQQGELQRVFPGDNRFAMGGPVGTDTIPAWLSPGEFVVRAQSVRKNFDVLQAINAGTFQRFANGGSVSNSQVFSSTFNMKTTNPQMQAAQIMSIMKRHISQGKATLGKGRPY